MLSSSWSRHARCWLGVFDAASSRLVRCSLPPNSMHMRLASSRRFQYSRSLDSSAVLASARRRRVRCLRVWAYLVLALSRFGMSDARCLPIRYARSSRSFISARVLRAWCSLYLDSACPTLVVSQSDAYEARSLSSRHVCCVHGARVISACPMLAVSNPTRMRHALFHSVRLLRAWCSLYLDLASPLLAVSQSDAYEARALSSRRVCCVHGARVISACPRLAVSQSDAYGARALSSRRVCYVRGVRVEPSRRFQCMRALISVCATLAFPSKYLRDHCKLMFCPTSNICTEI